MSEPQVWKAVLIMLVLVIALCLKFHAKTQANETAIYEISLEGL